MLQLVCPPSFQCSLLIIAEILESSSIAWPNPSMWRRAPFTASMPVPAFPSEDVDSHAHSPRRRPRCAADPPGYPGPVMQGTVANASSGSDSRLSQTIGFNNPQPICTVSSGYEADPFGCSAATNWLGNMGVNMNDVHLTGRGHLDLRKERKTSTDISMPDYSSSSQSAHMSFSGDETLCLPPFLAEEDAYFGSMKVPTNTPITHSQRGYESAGKGLSCLDYDMLLTIRRPVSHLEPQQRNPSRSGYFIDKFAAQSTDAAADAKSQSAILERSAISQRKPIPSTN